MTTEIREVICEVEFKNDILTVVSPKGGAVEIEIVRGHCPAEIQELADNVELIGDGSFGLTIPQMQEIKAIYDRQQEIKNTSAEILPPAEISNPIVPVVVGNEIHFPNVAERPTYFQKPDGEFAISKNNKSIVNLDSDNTYCVVSNRYKLQRHEEAVDKMREALEQTGLTDYEMKIDLTDDGGLMTAQFVFPKIKHEIQLGDMVSPMLKCHNAYIVGSAFKAYMSGLRLACTNGMTRAERLATYQKMHTKSLDMDDMKRVLVNGIENFKTQVEDWQRWTTQAIDQETLDQLQGVVGKREFDNLVTMEEITSKKAIMDFAHYEEIKVEGKEEPESKLILNNVEVSKWLISCIMTQYITHHMTSQKKKMRSFEALGRIFN